MKSFPNKFIPASDSIISNMLLIMQKLPENGIPLELLQIKVASEMDTPDFIDALTCLFAISSITVENNIISKL